MNNVLVSSVALFGPRRIFAKRFVMSSRTSGAGDPVSVSDDKTRSRLAIGEAIWFARERKGLTQVQLAAMVNVSRPQIANLETGRGEPSVTTLEEIARATECEFRTDGDWWYVA